MFGNTPIAAWGTSEWGAVVPETAAVFALDGVASGDLDAIVGVDALAALVDQDATAALDGVVSGDVDAVFGLDAAPALLPPEVYAKLTTSPYVLVELLLPGGGVWVAAKNRCAMGRVFDARLIGSGEILRTIGAGTDDLRLEIDDTTSNGAARFRDLFALDDPEGSVVNVWLGAEGALDAEHLLVFEGKIEQVQGFSNTAVRLQVTRREQVEDQLLGQLVDQATFPDAPAESLTVMLPIVFGVLGTHRGVVVNTNVVGTTRFNVFAADSVLQLVDASEFPSSGQVLLGGELISYAGKTGDTLTGLTRGAGGTIAADHAKGLEVAEIGIFSVKFASHGLGYMRRFKLRLPSGNLGDPVPQPDVVDPANALATWSGGLPQIRDPDARPTYQRIHFRDPDPFFNNALNPQFAARENKGYEAFRVAQVQPGGTLSLRTNTEGLGQPGDISRAWLGVIFDPESVVNDTAVALVGGTQYVLLPSDTVPDEIARNDERTGDRIYDVPPPVIDVTAPAPVGFSATPQTVAAPGLFQTQVRARNLVDKDDDTFACYAFVGLGESLIAGGGDVIYKWDQQEWERAFHAGSSATQIEIRALMGDDIVPLTSPWEIYLRLDSKEIPGTRLRCETLTPLGLLAGFIRGIEEFKLDVTGKFDPYLANAWERFDMVLHPITGVSSGLWCGHEVSIQGLVTPPKPTVSATQDVRQSVTNYFEVTDKLLVVNGEKSWTSFSDLASLGRVFFQGGGGEPRLIETFWVVEFTPFVQASSRVPEVFADVSGLVPSGNPVEIARTLINRAPPEGLGLGPDRIDQADYLKASASLAADAVRADFAIESQVGVVPFLSELAAQTDCSETWENKRHRIVRMPRADLLVPVDFNLSRCDLLADGPGVNEKVILRGSAREVQNRVTANWRFYAPSGATSRTSELNDVPSQAGNLGVREGVLELTLLQDDASALLVAQRKLERVRVPRWIVEGDVPIYGVSYRQGSLVALSDPDFSFQVGEITQVNLSTSRLKKTRIQIVVWLK